MDLLQLSLLCSVVCFDSVKRTNNVKKPTQIVCYSNGKVIYKGESLRYVGRERGRYKFIDINDQEILIKADCVLKSEGL